MAQNFNVNNLVLICVLVPRRHSKWLDKLTPVETQKFIKTISTQAETLITAQPSRKNWHSLGATVHRDIRVNLRVFNMIKEKRRVNWSSSAAIGVVSVKQYQQQWPGSARYVCIIT